MRLYYFLSLGLLIWSCSSEESTTAGCMEPIAINFSPDADISGDCTYERDRYIGNYEVMSKPCSPEEDLLAVFNIRFDKAEQGDQIKLIVDNISTQTLLFTGVVDGTLIQLDKAEFDAFAVNETLSFVYNGVPYRHPIFILDGDLTEVSDSEVSGVLSISAIDRLNNDARIFQAQCNIILKKKLRRP